MEYVSIPWERHRNGDAENYKHLTVNLALWFIHILAGNHHEVDWEYPPLEKEELIKGSCCALNVSQSVPRREESDSPQRLPRLETTSFSRKRGRSDAANDAIHHSFTESQPLATQVHIHLHRRLGQRNKKRLIYIFFSQLTG
jgi:hypothetical protein